MGLSDPSRILVAVVLFIFILGLLALILGAELLVRGSSRLALSFGISPLVVGLTIVALGTSAPEIAVSFGSALRGTPDLAVGNVVGSNIFNVLFILGISALVAPLVVHAQIVRQEVPIMVGATLLLLVQAQDGVLSLVEAGLLLLLLASYTVFLVVQSRRMNRDSPEASIDAGSAAADPGGEHQRHWGFQVLLIAGGLALLVVGSNWLVESATTFARALGVSDLVIGLTVVAAGTSLPEVATSVTAALRGERDIAIGNVVGSNIFNILGCLGATGIVAAGGIPISPEILAFDLWVMLAVAIACIPVFLTGHEIARWEGGLFLIYYVAYTSYLVLAATGHSALPSMRNVMLSFVLPLTVVTLVVSVVRSPKVKDGIKSKRRSQR